MRQIATSQIPQWAQDLIRMNTSWIYTESRDDGSLRIVGEQITFNGMMVVDEVVAPQQETILLRDVPVLVRQRIIATEIGSTLQSTVNDTHLQIKRDGTILYNGMRVLRDGEELL